VTTNFTHRQTGGQIAEISTGHKNVETRQNMPDDTDKLLNPSKMDGPTVSWTVADLFVKNPKVAMAYHVSSAGYDYMTVVGVAVGGLLSFTPLGKNSTPLSMMATSGLIGGCTGMAAGLMAMQAVSRKGNEASPPWNEDGIQQRVNGLQHNYKVRALDRGVWLGIAATGGLLAVTRTSPLKWGLHSGTLGVLQALSLGSAVGSVISIGCIFATTVGNDMPEYGDDDD
jgi:hypothetical protein